MLKLLTTAASVTFMQVKNLLNPRLALVNAKLEELSNKLNELDSTVKVLNNNYEELLKQIKKTRVCISEENYMLSTVRTTMK